MGNVARPKATQGESKTTRGEGLVPRSRQSGHQPYSRATEKKTRQPLIRFSHVAVPGGSRHVPSRLSSQLALERPQHRH